MALHLDFEKLNSPRDYLEMNLWRFLPCFYDQLLDIERSLRPVQDEDERPIFYKPDDLIMYYSSVFSRLLALSI